MAHILEGSVQKSGDAVRVNVQLIKATNDSHVWADTFDRKLTDIFSVESEVAKAIADQLRAKLTGQEEQLIAAKPTDNVEAYTCYLKARELFHRGSKSGYKAAREMFVPPHLQQRVRDRLAGPVKHLSFDPHAIGRVHKRESKAEERSHRL